MELPQTKYGGGAVETIAKDTTSEARELRARSARWTGKLFTVVLAAAVTALASACSAEADTDEGADKADDGVASDVSSDALGGMEYYVCTPNVFFTGATCATLAWCVSEKIGQGVHPGVCMSNGSPCFNAAVKWWVCHQKNYPPKGYVCKAGNVTNRATSDDVLCKKK